jgi:uncharacterized protein (DUF2235 family)
MNDITPRATRRIVLCLDGTWNSTYQQRRRTDGTEVLKPSNVLKLYRSLSSNRALGEPDQVAYYDIGVGSLARYPGISNRLLARADRLLGGGWGAGFEGNIEDALTFLAVNYLEGDELFVFGFSRGAATARGLTHFLDWSDGLPKREDAYYLPNLYRDFVRSRGQGSCSEAIAAINAKRAAERRPLPPLAQFHPVRVVFLGVWDTVMALGSRFRARGARTSVSRSFYVNDQPARCVEHARQALAIDEVRYDFRPEIWTGCGSAQTLKQRWFAGVHANVGGGYVDDGLANLAFQWILREAHEQGLQIDKQFSGHFRGFAQDRLYRSESVWYRMLDRVRFRFGRGKRRLLEQPPAAHLSIDVSVIHRLQADPAELTDGIPGRRRFPEMDRPYRPQNVIAFLAAISDLSEYLQDLGLQSDKLGLPADVIHAIDSHRGNQA